MRVGLFFGSFDPPHIGHVNVVAGVINSGLVDQVLVILAYQNVWKGRSTRFPYRYAMCCMAFDNLPNVFVSDIEKDNILIGFVLDTIIGNLEKGIDIGKSKNFEIASKIYLESISEPIPDELLEETVETFSYNAYEYNDTPYYKEVIKVFSKKLTHNINEWFN